MEILRNTKQVASSGTMLVLLLIFLIHEHCVLAQGPEGFFNKSSYVSITSLFDVRGRTSFSFRTCSNGELLYQEGISGDFVNVTLLPSSSLEFAWQVNRLHRSVVAGSNLIDNRWHDVDLVHNLGTVTLSVSKNSVLVANNTYNTDLFDLRLESAHPQLTVGRGFTGCILQGAGVVLNDSSIYSYEVDWRKCPLPNTGTCEGYLVDPCFNQPCHKNSKCISLPTGYQCECTNRYTGPNCDIDTGPLCNKPEYNQCQNGGTCQEDILGNSTICACPPKFTGVYCETMVDNTFCDFMPCRNGGTCNINQFRTSYVCTCPRGFAGVDCELNVDECQSFPCQNNGTCTDEINSYSCDCSNTGYRGPNCEENINECEESNPCYTGSQCFDRYGDYMCDCPPGFGGKNCDQEVNECDSSPCQNKGTCTDNLNGYLCHCVAGFAGINCEENIDDCNGVSCPAHSHCVDGIDSFSCVCDIGYSGAVPHCQEIDECAQFPCLNGGSCHDLLNGFECTCLDGFVGAHCEINLDECESNPCRNGATCVDGAGKYTCECVMGYSGINCEVDINDCEPNPCKNGANCTDLVNDFVCECLPGWEGKTCFENINECLSQPCMHGQCVDSLSNFTCNCDPGYSGTVCDININECDSSPCFNGGTCTDLINDFSCECPENFMGKNCGEVYDACGSSPCLNGGTCQTTIPSHEFSCLCPEGFLGNMCEVDVNDCEGIVCPAGKICVDLQNSYECRCPAGFSGDDCSINIDECSSNPCMNGTCVDGIGAFACHCPQGLTGRLCETDINECEDFPCQHGICQNMFGTYLCYCTPGYTGTHCDIEFNECLSSPCQNGATCNDLVNNYSCSCVPGFAGRNCEIDINECDSNPCLNGATCSDQINKYECTCIPGFSGQNCEINIDECASQPCQNGGKCVDLINEFVCNCTDTGFSGMFCETNINDCDPNPCQNGASCEDMIKDYHCQCYEGYNGKNCDNDIDECANSPCLNSALCLENSNQTLYEMNYLGFFPTFSYEMASGYRCICASGFTGENCETNIDDCEFNECKKGICIDAINDYYCACHLGYDGQHCEREINECEMLEPCENGATCVDLIADYKCECLPDFGGKNCQTKLIGCLNVNCLNGATCIPLLDERNEHIHICQCSEGFHGQSCETATTVSFDTGDSLSVTRYNDLLDTFNLEFQFRTTLPSGIISAGYVSNSMLQYVLYLWNGVIKVDVYSGIHHIAELFSKSGQNDALWKTVKLQFVPNEVSLNVTGWALQKRVNFSSLNFTVQFGSISNMALVFDQKLNIPDFIGCVQDIYMNGDIIIPNDNSILHGAKEGCLREEQCEGSPCHNGFCKDNWLSYECVCSRPFFGVTCQYSYEAATFGFQNQKSRAELVLSDTTKAALTDSMELSFFARTRNESGLLFYLGPTLGDSSNCSLQGMNNDTFILARLISGKLQVVLKQQNGDITELTHDEQLNNGNNYYIQVYSNSTELSLKVNGTIQNKPISSSSICMEVLYIADLPSNRRQKRQIQPQRFTDKIDTLLLEDISFFKGVIQDFRVNDEEVVFYELVDQGEGFPKVFGKAVLSDAVQKGVVSDDPCNTIHPCLHGSGCKDVWNEYVCICPDDYRGKNCEERKPCADNNCPADSECRNLRMGYECVASAAFDGKQSGIHYEVRNTAHTFMNISFSFRSNSSGTILWIDSNPTSESDHFLHIEMVSHTLEVKWDLGPSRENEAFHKTVSQKIAVTNGDWHHVQIWFDGNLVHLKVSGNSDNLSEDNYSIGLSELLNGGANVYLGYKPGSTPPFKGCLNDVRIGGVLLSFFDTNLFPNSDNPFHIVSKELEIGCKLCWDDDCEHGTCNNHTDSYDCSCYDGYEGQYCEVDLCITNNPCNHGGSCSHTDSMLKLMCSCPKGFTGATCNEIDLCELTPCLNGGTCSQMNNRTSCSCPPYYEGDSCEKSIIRDCTDVLCLHGTCVNIDLNETVKFKCVCHDGYEGEFCDKPIDFCGSHPCRNGGTCQMVVKPDSATYTCFCPSGFTGDHCEKNVNECDNDPCDRGMCVDEIGHFRCDCYPGYKGKLCSDPIRHCTDAPNVCYNGTCEDAPGGYKCKCFPQFLGTHCSVYDECHPSKCNQQGVCEPMYDENELLFIHTCSCNDGFTGHDCTKELARGGDDTNLILIILIPVMSLFILCLLIGSIVFLRIAKKKRATRGTYSPSRQEMFGSRVEMNHVMKPPPEERLI